jgi:hypothetical protein
MFPFKRVLQAVSHHRFCDENAVYTVYASRCLIFLEPGLIVSACIFKTVLMAMMTKDEVPDPVQPYSLNCCCFNRKSMKDAFTHAHCTQIGILAAEGKFDYLIIESSGISEPMQVSTGLY